MKFLHISDLHIGKRVNGFSMLEDQRYILGEILDIVRAQRPDGVLIAGDLYDKSLPSAEAVELADMFLSRLAEEKVYVWLISGNHDSAERIAYAGRMLEQAGIFVSRVFDGQLQQYTVTKYADETVQAMPLGKAAAEINSAKKISAEKNPDLKKGQKIMEQVDITLLPFLRPAQVRRFYSEKTIDTTQQALEAVLEGTELHRDRVNILLMHQFMTGASTCESEEISVGGSDQVDVSVVEDFDYVALGHLHGPQKVSRESVRYSGSPLKYSFSEASQKKSVTVVETGAFNCKESIKIAAIPLTPRLDLREIKGPIDALLKPEIYDAANPMDYLHITLTDEGEILDAIGRLRQVYPNIMKLDFAANTGEELKEEEILLEEKTPRELFGEFFFRQNGREMSGEQSRIVDEVLKSIAAE